TMLKEKMRPYPHFSTYIDVVNTLATTGNNSKFAAWNKVIDGILFDQKRGSYNDITGFLDFSKSLFEKNAMYDSKARQWIASSKEYTFSYDNKKPKLTFPAQTISAYSSLDTQVIENTSGVLFPLEKTWTGNNGKVDWGRAGLPE